MINLIIFAKLLLIVGGIAWGIYGTMKINIIKQILPNILAQNFVYVLIGLSALILIFNRNFYLPFLDQTVMPYSFFNNNKKPNNATFSIKVKVEPNSRVIYWGSEPTNHKNQLVDVAYGKFENSGITTADRKGNAILILRKPSSYIVKKKLFNKKLKPHVHYRYTLPNGMMSQVFTKKISTKNITKNSPVYSPVSSSIKSPVSSPVQSPVQSPVHAPAHLLKSDLTHLTKCKCMNRHLNMHDTKCAKQFQNKIILEHNPILNKEDNYEFSDKFQKFTNFNDKNLENNKENNLFNNILRDRDLHSDMNIENFPPLLYQDSKVKFDENYSNFN